MRGSDRMPCTSCQTCWSASGPCWTTTSTHSSTAQLARQHNDANVVSIGARQHSDDEVTALVVEFLKTPFSGEERHARRIALISDYERDRHRPAGGLPTRP